MVTLTSIFILALTFSSFSCSSPLSLGIWILYLTLLISLTSALIFSTWLAIFILLIYVSGLLVIFAYFAALTPNRMFIISNSYKTFFLSFSVFLSYYSLLNITYTPSYFLTNNFSYNNFSYMFIDNNIPIFIFLVLFLFFVLVAVVKISNFSSGPLRSWL